APTPTWRSRFAVWVATTTRSCTSAPPAGSCLTTRSSPRSPTNRARRTDRRPRSLQIRGERDVLIAQRLGHQARDLEGARRRQVRVIVAEEVADRAGGRRADVAARDRAERVLLVERDRETVQIDHGDA